MIAKAETASFRQSSISSLRPYQRSSEKNLQAQGLKPHHKDGCNMGAASVPRFALRNLTSLFMTIGNDQQIY